MVLTRVYIGCKGSFVISLEYGDQHCFSIDIGMWLPELGAEWHFVRVRYL